MITENRFPPTYLVARFWDRPAAIQADLVFLDANDEPVLLAVASARPESDEYAQQALMATLRAARVHVPYGMLVNRQTIRLSPWDGTTLLAPVCELSAASVLSVYGAEFATSHIGHDYLATLAGAWLNDLAYSWKCATPPGFAELQAAGIVEKLREGMTLSLRALE